MSFTDQFVTFKLDDQRFGLRINQVERIIRAIEITPLPQAPQYVLGIINIHGDVIPILDIRKRFQFHEKIVSLNDQFIIIKTVNKRFSIIANEVDGSIIHVEMVPTNAIWSNVEYIEGVVKHPDGLILINDVEKLFLPEEQLQFEQALKHSLADE